MRYHLGLHPRLLCSPADVFKLIMQSICIVYALPLSFSCWCCFCLCQCNRCFLRDSASMYQPRRQLDNNIPCALHTSSSKELYSSSSELMATLAKACPTGDKLQGKLSQYTIKAWRSRQDSVDTLFTVWRLTKCTSCRNSNLEQP